MNGSGCKNCPVKPCETMNYRGSACAAQRAKFGLGDPMTNADRIRAMTDEELADWISNFVYEIGSGEVAYSDDTDQWLFWLQQPCKGE